MGRFIRRYRRNTDKLTEGLDAGIVDSLVHPAGGEPPPTGYYLSETWESGTVPSPWVASTFFNYQGANASVAIVPDPLSQKGQVARLRCPYTPGTMAVNSSYPSSILQQAAINIQPSNSRADQGDDTWYRADFMFPTGNVFCNGFSNFLVEWHTQATGPLSTGLFAYGSYPLTTGGTQTPKLVMVVRSTNISSPTETFFPPAGGVSTLAASQGITIQTNRWYKSVWHFKWSADPLVGLFEWYLDDVLQVSKTMATHFTLASEILFYSCYNYRYHVTGDSNIYYDTLALGPTRASVGG